MSRVIVRNRLIWREINTHAGRRDITYLCSYPKCGRTWLRFLLANYLVTCFGLDFEVDFHSVFRLIPNLARRNPAQGIGAFTFGDVDNLPLLLASHQPYDRFTFGQRPVLLVVRAASDVVTSYYFHQTRHLNRYEGTLAAFIRDPEQGIRRYVGYLNSWGPRLSRPGVYVISYERLRQDTAGALADIITFLGLPREPQAVDEAVRLSSADRMRRLEEKKGVVGHTYQQSDPEARRVRQARIGGSTQYLSAEDRAYIEQAVSKQLHSQIMAIFRERGIELLPFLNNTRNPD